ncbi:arsenic resistance N-acetyltransferase ArsN2 [Burkholderia cepacia]|uniref:arsenic resistance N-acetyltransferase ArsN2 n=1 Tax=Burkholderia cepacia TaxID=292 RepID=UPI000758F7FF|nr:arsenic resistance N-acetyltransferase ArsN2 [Burkholderia cepacia]KVS26318.1 GCN5 family acetyltransferase [Burkholderia cepacia]MCA8119435.1 arsenic resistance N-acetyltransferase ArsN2 [Burkholderia cepacia]
MNTHGIRPAHAGDYRSIRALLESESLPTQDVTVEQIPRFYVAPLADAGLLGCIAYEHFGSDALLRSLAVANGSRRQGLGHALVATIERDAASNGVRRLFLLTTTAADYFTAIGYQKFDRNFVPDELQATSQFASLCPASAICMIKNL